MSVRLSVRLSVTRVDQPKLLKLRLCHFHLTVAPIYLIFADVYTVVKNVIIFTCTLWRCGVWSQCATV